MNKELLIKSIIKEGENYKLFLAIEECSELQYRLCKILRNKDVGKEELIQDISDLQICIENLKLIYEISDEELLKNINKIIEEKK